MPILSKLLLATLLFELVACGPPLPCECPASWFSDPIPLTLDPTPASASISVAEGYVWVGPQMPEIPNSAASCNSPAECSHLELGLGVGTFVVSIEATGYQNASQSFTFTSEGSCCPSLSPSTVRLSLTAAAP